MKRKRTSPKLNSKKKQKKINGEAILINSPRDSEVLPTIGTLNLSSNYGEIRNGKENDESFILSKISRFSQAKNVLSDEENEILDISDTLGIDKDNVIKIKNITLQINNVNHKLVQMIRSKREILALSNLTIGKKGNVMSYSDDDLITLVECVMKNGMLEINLDEVRKLLSGGDIIESDNYYTLNDLLDNIKSFKSAIGQYIDVYNAIEGFCKNISLPKSIMEQIKGISLRTFGSIYNAVEGKSKPSPMMRAFFRVIIYIVRLKCIKGCEESDVIVNNNGKFVDDSIDIMYNQRHFWPQKKSQMTMKKRIFNSSKLYNKCGSFFQEAVKNNIAYISNICQSFPRISKMKKCKSPMTKAEMNLLQEKYAEKHKVLRINLMHIEKGKNENPPKNLYRSCVDRAIKTTQFFANNSVRISIMFELNGKYNGYYNDRRLDSILKRGFSELDRKICSNIKCREEMESRFIYCPMCNTKQ